MVAQEDRPIKVWGGVTQEQLDKISKDNDDLASLLPSIESQIPMWSVRKALKKDPWSALDKFNKMKATSGSSSSGNRTPASTSSGKREK